MEFMDEPFRNFMSTYTRRHFSNPEDVFNALSEIQHYLWDTFWVQ